MQMAIRTCKSFDCYRHQLQTKSFVAFSLFSGCGLFRFHSLQY
jgi:hypothetical protein